MKVAQVDASTNKVKQVILVNKNVCLGPSGAVTQAATEAHCDPLYGAGDKYYPLLSTTKNYPCVGFNYDASKDMYYEDQPYADWTLNDSTGIWEAPVDFVNGGGVYSKETWDTGSATWFSKKLGDMDGNWWKWNKSTNVWEDTGSTSK